MKQWIVSCKAAVDRQQGGRPQVVKVVIECRTPEAAIYAFRRLYDTPKGHVTVTPVQVPVQAS
jgi:hypothetical protein